MKKITTLFCSSILALACPLYSNDATQSDNNRNTSIESIHVDKADRCSSCGKPRTTKDAPAESLSTSSVEKCGCSKPRPPRDVAMTERAEQSDAEKCGCGKPRPPRDVETLHVARPSKCSSCQQGKSSRDAASRELATTSGIARDKQLYLDPEVEMVYACCEYCEQPGSLGCQGENSVRCSVCQEGKIKQSIKDAAAAALAATVVSDKMRDEKENN